MLPDILQLCALYILAFFATSILKLNSYWSPVASLMPVYWIDKNPTMTITDIVISAYLIIIKIFLEFSCNLPHIESLFTSLVTIFEGIPKMDGIS